MLVEELVEEVEKVVLVDCVLEVLCVVLVELEVEEVEMVVLVDELVELVD